MTETKTDLLAKLDLPALERLRDHYEARQDSQSVEVVRAAIGLKGSVQTDELANSGKLFRHRVDLDPSGLGTRPAWAFTGDPLAWMKEFMSAGAVSRVDRGIYTGVNSIEAKARAVPRGGA